MVSADELRRAFARGTGTRRFIDLPGRTNHLSAGVLVPLVFRPRLTTLLTLRPAGLRHGGEICFPGGRPDPGDADLAATARREAYEELGLEEIEILGRLASIPLLTSDYRIEPFVALTADRYRANPAEVEEVYSLEIEALLALEAVPAIAWDLGGVEHLSPVFEIQGRLLFGATAHALYELLGVLAPLFGGAPPPLVPGRYEWDLSAGRPRPA